MAAGQQLPPVRRLLSSGHMTYEILLLGRLDIFYRADAGGSSILNVARAPATLLWLPFKILASSRAAKTIDCLL